MHDGSDVIIRTPGGALGIHGVDAEQEAVFAFLARYKARTRENYELDLRLFREWLATLTPAVHTLLAVQRPHVQMYVRYLDEKRGHAPSTINRRVGTLRSFYKIAIQDDHIVKDPTFDVTVPKIDRDAQYRTWLTTLEFAALLKQARKDPRSHAMVAALGLLGMRVAEMCSLDATDIHREVGEVYITFTGKGSKQAKIGLPFEVLQAFDSYAAGRDIGPLFLTRAGDRWTPADVRRALTTLARHAGIERHITPHGLRRTLARLLQERGVELGAIQQTLRHADPRVTVQSYIGRDTGVADIARQQAAAVVSGMAS